MRAVNMEMRGIRSLLQLAETGSITRTAEKLNLTAAAIHKQLRVLEGELGIKLYEKDGRQLRLTQAAEIILPHARSMLAHHDATLEALNEWKGLKHGLVRIGAGPTMSSYLLPGLLEDFRKRHPDVELFIETGNSFDLAQHVGRGSLDVAFLVSSERLTEPNLHVEATWNFEIGVVGSATQAPPPPPQQQQRCRMIDLQSHPFILYKEGSLFESIIDGYFRKTNLAPRVVMRLDNAEAIKAMVRAGLGLSMLPLWTLGGELESRELRLIRQQEVPLYANIALMTRNLSYHAPAVRAFTKLARSWNWKNAQLKRQSIAEENRR